MARGVSFFMDAQDEIEFVRHALASPSVVLLPQSFRSNSLPEYRSLEDADAGKKQFSLLIWNKELASNLRVINAGDSGIRYASPDDELLISFQRSCIVDGYLTSGGISAEMYALNGSKTGFVFKGKQFESWYNKLARRIRNHYARDAKFGICIGLSAKAALERGEFQLARHMTSAGPILW